MPKVCKEVFERMVVHTQYKLKEEKVDSWGESYFKVTNGELKVEYEDKLLEIKILNHYGSLELSLNTNIYKDGIIVGKVYKIELDSEGDILYFLEPEYKLVQPDGTFKEYLVKIQDVETYVKLEEDVASLKAETYSKYKEIVDLRSGLENRDIYADKLEKELAEIKVQLTVQYDIIKSKECEIAYLSDKIKVIRCNIIDEMKDIMKNATVLERFNTNRFMGLFNELKKY